MKKRLYIDAWVEIPKKEAKRLQEVGEKGIFTFRLDSANIHTTVYRLAKHLELEQGSETSYYGLFIPPSNDEVIKLRLSDHKSSPSEWLKYELHLPNRRYSIVVFNSKSMHIQYSNNCEYIDWTSYDVEGINVHELCISCKYLIKYWSFLRQILSGIYNGENVEKYSIERYAISLKGYESSNDMVHDWNKTMDKITENKQNTNMKTENRNVVRLTESKLRNMIKESIKSILKESESNLEKEFSQWVRMVSVNPQEYGLNYNPMELLRDCYYGIEDDEEPYSETDNMIYDMAEDFANYKGMDNNSMIRNAVKNVAYSNQLLESKKNVVRLTESQLKQIVAEELKKALNESDDVKRQWESEKRAFFRGLKSGKAYVDGDTVYVEIGRHNERDPRYVYFRFGGNKLMDDHFYVQSSPALSRSSIRKIYQILDSVYGEDVSEYLYDDEN